MISYQIYLVSASCLIALGLFILMREPSLFRKVIAINVMSSGIALLLVAFASRSGLESPDPVPHAMVLTGIVVSVCATAVGLGLVKKYRRLTGRSSFPDEKEDGA